MEILAFTAPIVVSKVADIIQPDMAQRASAMVVDLPVDMVLPVKVMALDMAAKVTVQGLDTALAQAMAADMVPVLAMVLMAALVLVTVRAQVTAQAQRATAQASVV